MIVHAMTDQPLPDPAVRISRRHLLAAGGAGVAALWFGPGWSVDDGVAEAATLRSELRRSAWLQVTDPVVHATVDGRTAALRLTQVADLPIADQLAALRDHDGAFALRFVGPAGLPQGAWSLQQADLGTFELFVVPIERRGSTQTYEAIVDRTVRIAGVNEDPVPAPRQITVPEARAEQPAPAVGATGPGAPRSSRTVRASKPRLRRVALRRGASGRVILAELALADATTVGSVHGLLFARGKVVARTSVAVRRPGRVPLRFAGRRTLPRGRYELHLTLVARNGRVTRIRKKVRFS